jgi:hypothetical protein
MLNTRSKVFRLGVDKNCGCVVISYTHISNCYYAALEKKDEEVCMFSTFHVLLGRISNSVCSSTQLSLWQLQ